MYQIYFFQIAVFVFLALSSQVHCSGILTPHVAAPAVPVAPALRYRLVAPQNIRPFAAQVSTFTKGLNIFDAPHAAGVLSGPAVVPRAIIPGIPPVPAYPVGGQPALPPPPVAPVPGFIPAPVYPAPVYPAPVAPAPAYPAPLVPAPVFPAPAAPVYTGFGPAPVIPAAPAYPAFSAVPSPVLPAPPIAGPVAPVAAPVAPVGVPTSLLPGPFHRSVHAVAPPHPHAALLG